MSRLVAVWLLFVAPLATAQTQWLDVNREPLPFATDAELLEFLRTAPVVDQRDIGIGVNRSQKVTLERDGVQVHAAFRRVDIRRQNQRVGDRFYRLFADSYLFECAAYQLATMLGLDMIPPAVLRKIRGDEGSLQIWVEDVRDEASSDFHPPNPTAWAQQIWGMILFDNLVYNPDRNKGNMLADSHYRLWLIDHTRAFQAVNQLLNDRIARVDRAAFDRLVALSENELQSSLGKFLTSAEMSSLVRRRELLIEYVEALVAERGGDAVYY
jgi:hypothetical protein